MAAQTLLLAVSVFFTWRTISEAGRERERERREARRRDEEAKLDYVAHRALEVYEAAEAWRAGRPEARLFEPTQRRLAYALAVAPGLLSEIPALARMVGDPASSITDDLVSQALDEVEEAVRELRRT